MLEKLDKFLLLTAETSPTYLLTQSDKGAHKDKTKSKDFDKTKPNFPDGETDQRCGAENTTHRVFFSRDISESSQTKSMSLLIRKVARTNLKCYILQFVCFCGMKSKKYIAVLRCGHQGRLFVLFRNSKRIPPPSAGGAAHIVLVDES